ncbi:helix-turn-helix transcriptional regulator [Daejeonella sp.]|uniref:helix-turn-helix domain-containing protein n=1 Tax=Daejeonella sp. TaxID=2805397 RepID=UPI00271746AC|nr:helix-turn-helix transcriptional regulator [Daejeonella sp.]MDO8994079.1 helix-turn-helix transcriptional regulator [Daejeonella sp.]MDP2414811.1 helix-turn-helix transcriptional regulator [Daejeonella sp.]
MTLLGKYLAKRSVNKSEVSRRTGISKVRISELTLNTSTKLRADELYLIALAINVDPCEILKEVCGHLKLEK